jgi:hypothetical protein
MQPHWKLRVQVGELRVQVGVSRHPDIGSTIIFKSLRWDTEIAPEK